MTGRRGVAAIAVAVALVVAGCGGFAGSGPGSVAGPETPPTETVTPAPVPTETATTESPSTRTTLSGSSDRPRFPPGVDSDGVENSLALATAHLNRLDDRSFTVRSDLSVRGPNRTIYVLDRTIRVSPGGDRLRIVQTYETDGYPLVPARAPYVELWLDGSTAWYRLIEDGDAVVAVNRSLQFRGPTTDPTGYVRIATVFGGFETRLDADAEVPNLTGVPHALGSGEAVTVRSVGLSDGSVLELPPLVVEPRNATLSATVEPSGLVRSYRLAYDATYDGERVRVVRRFRVSAVGSTALDRPAWATRDNATSGATAGSVPNDPVRSSGVTGGPGSTRVEPPAPVVR